MEAPQIAASGSSARKYNRKETFLDDAASAATALQSSPLGLCGVDKEGEKGRRRRTTGGILTCVLSCGLLVDWIEMWQDGFEFRDYRNEKQVIRGVGARLQQQFPY